MKLIFPSFVYKILVFVSFSIFFGIVLSLENKTFPIANEKKNVVASSVQIIQVFDGDTFSAKINGVTEKIRILGIDTPEVAGGYQQAECYGENASAFAKKMLAGKSVTLIPSQTGDDTDQYGRYLRYVEIDGTDFGKTLLAEGYAQSYKKFPHDRKSDYNSTEQKAKLAYKGLWGKCFK